MALLEITIPTTAAATHAGKRESNDRTAGLARALLRVLERRFRSIPGPIRERMSSTHDEQQLLRWLDRAVTAASVEDVFGDEES